MFKTLTNTPGWHLIPCNELGWVKHLLKPPANVPEPTSRTLHWTSLGSALISGPTHIPEPTSRSLHGNRLGPAKSLQSCPTLCDPIDGSPTGSPISGIHQARTLEWVAISFSNAWTWKWSRSVLSDSLRPHGLQPTRVLHPWDFPGKSTGVGCHCPALLKSLTNTPEPTSPSLHWTTMVSASVQAPGKQSWAKISLPAPELRWVLPLFKPPETPSSHVLR